MKSKRGERGEFLNNPAIARFILDERRRFRRRMMWRGVCVGSAIVLYVLVCWVLLLVSGRSFGQTIALNLGLGLLFGLIGLSAKGFIKGWLD